MLVWAGGFVDMIFMHDFLNTKRPVWFRPSVCWQQCWDFGWV